MCVAASCLPPDFSFSLLLLGLRFHCRYWVDTAVSPPPRVVCRSLPFPQIFHLNFLGIRLSFPAPVSRFLPYLTAVDGWPCLRCLRCICRRYIRSDQPLLLLVLHRQTGSAGNENDRTGKAPGVQWVPALASEPSFQTLHSQRDTGAQVPRYRGEIMGQKNERRTASLGAKAGDQICDAARPATQHNTTSHNVGNNSVRDEIEIQAMAFAPTDLPTQTG